MSYKSNIKLRFTVIIFSILFFFFISACFAETVPIDNRTAFNTEHYFSAGRVLTFYLPGRIITARILSASLKDDFLLVEKIRDTDINSHKNYFIINLAQLQVIENVNEED